MHFDNFQRLSILLQATASLENKEQFLDAEKVARFVAYRNEWAISWEYDYFDKEPHPKDAVVSETCEIFDMYRHIQNSYDELARGKTSLASKDVVFPGFDGNNDDHSGVASVLVEQLERYDTVKGATNNSHSRGTISILRNMLQTYQIVLQRGSISSTGWRTLTEAEIIEILN